MLFNYEIKYQAGKSNKTADSFIHHLQRTEGCTSDIESQKDETVSYTVIFDGLMDLVKGTKLTLDVKQVIQSASINNKSITVKNDSLVLKDTVDF